MPNYEKKSPIKDLKESARSMPNDTKMEQCILSCIMGASEEIKIKIITSLKVDDFYIESHKLIYEAVLEMYTGNKSIDFIF